MSKPETALRPDEGLVVLLLSSDQRLVTNLAMELESRRAGIELHVVRNQSTLEQHAGRARPDGVVIDLASVRAELQAALLASPGLKETPVVILGEMTAEAARRIGGRVTVIAPTGEHLRAICDVVAGGQRAARTAGRIRETSLHSSDILDAVGDRTAQIERLRALGELAAGVAHDFNNVLETVLGRIQRARAKLRRGEDPAADLAVVEEAARTATLTVRRIHDFVRPGGGESWQDVDLGHVTREAAELIATQIPERIRLSLDVHPTPVVRGNAAELREVLVNMLRNAVDAIEGEGRIELRCHAEEGLAVVEVEDTGCGMQPEVCRRAFEPFFSTKGGAGTGLGLSVSHGILRRHDAQIELESEPGLGTRFRLLFAPLESCPKPVTVPRRDALSVAVVDDDDAVAELMKDLLKELGHSVEVVGNPEDMLARIAESRVDLLITDLDLPGMSGWQLARSARRIHPNLLVGLVTGWPLGVTDAELKSRGVDFVLSKPFSIDALAEALQRLQD